MSSNSVVSLSSFNLLFFTQVLTVLTSSIKYNEYVTDKGKNISIPCIAEGNIMWVKENGNNSTIIQTGKFLVLTNISETDRGLYICFASVPLKRKESNDSDEMKTLETNLTKIASNENDKASSGTSNTATATTIKTSLPAPTNATLAKSTTPTTPPINATSTNSTADGKFMETALTATTSSLPKFTKTTTATTTTRKFTKITTANTKKIPDNQAENDEEEHEEQEFQAILKINIRVRTTPGPLTQLYFKASTILGFLIWRFNKTNSGGYPVRSFTAEYRNVTYKEPPYNSSFEHHWSRLDPINIAPNVRQMEVYRLTPNTTYEFRMWANNQLGSGEAVTTNVTTLPETKEEDLIRLIQPDLDNFDPRIWIVAVSIVLGTLVILAIGLCIVLSKECYQSSHMGYEDGWDSIELLPNIILNPGFSESDGEGGDGVRQSAPRTIIFGCDDDSDYTDSSDDEPRMEKFKRKVSVFFTGPTIKRI